MISNGLVVLALLVFVLAVFNVAIVENMVALGLAFYVAAQVVGMIPSRPAA